MKLFDYQGWCWLRLKKKFMDRGPFCEINDDDRYVILIVTRGEEVLYKDVFGEIAFSFYVDSCTIDLRPLRDYTDDSRRKIIVDRIERYFKNYRTRSVKFIE